MLCKLGRELVLDGNVMVDNADADEKIVLKTLQSQVSLCW
jgi:hypothetical protein